MKKIIFLGYRANDPVMSLLFRAMLFFFVSNVIFSGLFWYSFLQNMPVNLWYLNIDVSNDLPVKYFANNINKTIWISFPLLLMFLFIDIALNRKKLNFNKFKEHIHTEYKKDNPEWIRKKIFLIQDIYSGKLKSFLLPKNHGYLKIITIYLGVTIGVFVLNYYNVSIVYNKFYHSEFYNMFADFRSQSLLSFLKWNIFSLIVFQVITSITILGLFGFLLFVFKKEKAFEIYQLNNKAGGE